eukprot:TRINITY_DN73073_c0_g1_i1.p1 TRINITY_DN73073_c0_g1~~TRINITY_DN73073_c0_g1_i1.p1  ORF type:complete len:549 (-),score=90.71 TRINITY_DN73073_c0_g1_i1:80-1726(-)
MIDFSTTTMATGVTAPFEGSSLEPHQFPPPKGFGLRARHDLSVGDTALCLRPLSELALTPSRARALLFDWLSLQTSAQSPPPEERPFSTVSEVVCAQIVEVLRDEADVLQKCRACGIGEDNDGDRRAILGRCLRISEVDPSDDTVSLQGQGVEEVWMPISALRRAAPAGAASALRQEDALALCLHQLRYFGKDRGGVHPLLLNWIASLPETFYGPLNWSQEELAELEGSNYAPRAQGLRPAAVDAHGALLATFGAEVVGSVEDFLYALGAVRSRCFSITPQHFPSLAKKDDAAMIPYLDYLNHDPSLPNMEGHVRESSDSDGIEFVALHDCKEGEEVFTSYGLKPGAELLLGWGFMPDGNPHDGVELEVGIQRATIADPERVQLCLMAAQEQQSGGPLQCEVMKTPTQDSPLVIRVVMNARHALPTQFLSLCRLEKLNPVALAKLREHIGEGELAKRLRSGLPLVAESDAETELTVAWRAAEASCIRDLCAVFGALLGAYPTTLEEDEAIVASGLSEGPKQMALALRMAEKRILRAALAAAEALRRPS